MYYILQGFLFYTTLYIFTYNSVEKNKVQDYLHQNNITFSYYLLINLLVVVKRVLIEELLLRWLLYNKICAYFFSKFISLILYTLISYYLIKGNFVSHIDKFVWICQLVLHIHIYESTGTLWSSITVGIYGNIIKYI